MFLSFFLSFLFPSILFLFFYASFLLLFLFLLSLFLFSSLLYFICYSCSYYWLNDFFIFIFIPSPPLFLIYIYLFFLYYYYFLSFILSVLFYFCPLIRGIIYLLILLLLSSLSHRRCFGSFAFFVHLNILIPNCYSSRLINV